MKINEYKKGAMEEAFEVYLKNYHLDVIDEQGLRNLFFSGAFSVLFFMQAARDAGDAKGATDIFDEVVEWRKQSDL